MWSTWSLLSAGWKSVRGSQRNTLVKDDQWIGMGKQISLSFFIFGSVTLQLKLLQLRTAHQSIDSVFSNHLPPLLRGQRCGLGSAVEVGGASHFPVVFVVYALLVFFVCHHVIVFVA